VSHLWEVKHSYYCNLGNYFNNDCGRDFKSWADFMDDMGDADMDYNLVFRWDWVEESPETGEPNYNGDDNYRNGRLHIFWMGQRKGLYTFSTVEVCRADEPAVIAFLRPRMEYLFSLWEPLTTAEAKA
jgi:hypothetical protein